MASTWNHRICERCWFDGPGKLNDEPREQLHGRQPVRVVDYPPGLCCYCGGITILGIFTRAKPTDVPCQGEHDDSDDD